MSKIIKYVPVLFVWLAGLILIVHQVIPHDHHIASAYTDQDNKCPVTDQNSGDKTGLPVHCHAFNDLFQEKSRSFLISQNIQFSFIAPISNTDAEISLAQVKYKCIPELQESFKSTEPSDSGYLRAPPFSS